MTGTRRGRSATPPTPSAMPARSANPTCVRLPILAPVSPTAARDERPHVLRPEPDSVRDAHGWKLAAGRQGVDRLRRDPEEGGDLPDREQGRARGVWTVHIRSRNLRNGREGTATGLVASASEPLETRTEREGSERSGAPWTEPETASQAEGCGFDPRLPL